MNSSELQTLVHDVERGLRAALESAQRARIRALDPELAPSVLPEARQRMQDAEFRKQRLEAALPRLQAHLAAVLAAEENQRRTEAYDEAKRERDSLAAELKSLYPRMAKELTDLLARIGANDWTIEQINAHALPSGRGPLLSAELVARGLESFHLTDGRTMMTRIPKITTETRLPAFKFDQFEPHSWPPNPNRNVRNYKIFGTTLI